MDRLTFEEWFSRWWPVWQRDHGRGVSTTIDPDEKQALKEAFKAGRGEGPKSRIRSRYA